LLVVLAIVSILLALVGSAIAAARRAARDFLCKNNLKTITFKFTLFADDQAYASRGDDEGNRGFRIETFQESVYAIDEFWDLPGRTESPLAPSEQPLICPSGPQKLVRRRDLPCSDYAVAPAANVSIAFNMRLDRVSAKIGGRWVLAPVRLHSQILDHPLVPLVMDVDGEAADARGKLSYYTAPSADDPGLYAGNRFWFPARRHDGAVNVGFIDGHIASSPDPAKQAAWNWRYQPPIR
jgi:prepilin-type processing-associated H-X9-DG protein